MALRRLHMPIQVPRLNDDGFVAMPADYEHGLVQPEDPDDEEDTRDHMDIL